MLFTDSQRGHLVDSTLRWIERHVRFFAPPHEDAELEGDPEEIGLDGRRKAFAELGLALREGARSPAFDQHPSFAGVAATWRGWIDERHVFFDCRRRTGLFAVRVVAYAALRALGDPRDDVRVSLQAVLDRGFLERIENSAWNKLDLKHHLDDAGLTHALPDTPALTQQSSIFLLPSLPHVTAYDLYALTHIVFDVTDFGRANPVRVLGDHLDYVRAYASAALALALARQDWDLVAEILVVRLCLRETPDEFDVHAAGALVDALEPDGFLPGRDWTGSVCSPDDDVHYAEEFARVYHPTLVALILAACEARVP